MTYLSSADLLAVRSLAAESAFSLDHRIDLPPEPRTAEQSTQGPRTRIFTSGPLRRPAPTGLVHTTSTRPADLLAPSNTEPARLSTPQGKHHRPPTPTTEPAPHTEEPGYTLIDLRHRRVRWQHAPTDSHGNQREHGYGILIDLDAYRAHALTRLRSTILARTPLRQPTPYPRRRSARVRRYTHDLAPDERAEFATLRNTIRHYLGQRDNTGQNKGVAS